MAIMIDSAPKTEQSKTDYVTPFDIVILGFLLPGLGLIIGLIKWKTRRGKWIVATAALTLLMVWLAVVTDSAYGILFLVAEFTFLGWLYHRSFLGVTPQVDTCSVCKCEIPSDVTPYVVEDKIACQSCWEKAHMPEPEPKATRVPAITKRHIVWMVAMSSALCFLLVVTLFAIYIWPTKYRYDHIKSGSETYPMRTNRFTDETEVFAPFIAHNNGGWINLSPKRPAAGEPVPIWNQPK